MSILMVGGPRERGSRGPVRWAGLELWHTRSQFDQLVRYNQHTPEMLPRVRRSRVEAFSRAVRSFDVVFCETPEALLLAAQWSRLGLRPRPVVALAVEGLLRVEAMRRWHAHQGEPDPWPALRDARWVRWIAASSSQREILLDRGVPSSHVHFILGCTAHFGMFEDNIECQLAAGPEGDGELAHGLPEGEVLLAGGGRRDHVTGLRAVSLLPELPFCLIDELLESKRHQLGRAGVLPLPNLQVMSPLPLARFIALVRRARVLVVTLKAGIGDGGHTTVATAHRVGVPVVVTDVPGISDYVTGDEDAVLVPPGDHRALAEAVEALWMDRVRARRLVDAGMEREARRCEQASREVLAAIRGATQGLESG